MHILVVSASIRIDNVVAIEREGNVCIRSLIIYITQVLIHIFAVSASIKNDNDNIVAMN